MIFVVLGSQDKSFERLLKEVDRLIDKKLIKDEVIVQAGQTKYESKNMKIFDFIDMNEFASLINKSSYIITHAGVGTILDSIKQDKKIIAVPRLKKYKEHENDHQLQIIEEFNEKGYILGIKDVKYLEEAIKKINDFKPKKYVKNNHNFIKIIDKYIESI